MADGLTPESSRRRRRQREHGRGLARPLAQSFFALLVLLGPLAFGAVDRFVQIGLLGLLGVGMLVVPPQVLRLPGWLSRVLVAGTVILVVKELAPANWFGVVSWRSTLEQAYGLALPWTHHPEPGRALDGWLAGAVAVGWFAWVRTLAVEREDRTRLAWIMFLAAAIIAAVSFASVGAARNMIFGLRYTPGWLGFGPFPNRNHTACFFAMAVVLGAGCLARSGERRRFGLLILAVVLLGVLLVAVLRTHSRGGIVALGAGLAVFLGVVLLKLRNRKALAVSLAAALLVGGLGLLAGGKTLQRFAGTGQAEDDSASIRQAVWRNAAVMWRDAPLLGHGLGSFASVFPMYQDLTTEEVTIKHPESSWLQWLCELGLVPVVLGCLATLAFTLPYAGALFERQSSFFIRAAGFGVAATLLTHALFDVPAHRWGTAGFALAALALACPASSEGRRAPRFAALVPFGVAAFWLLPVWLEWPAWSTFQLDRLLASQRLRPGPPLREIETGLRAFPLNAQLHFARGERLLRAQALPPSRWQNEFRLALRLVPNSSQVCVRLAQICRREPAALPLHYWQLALERTTRQRAEIFGMALRETRELPGAAEIWQSYAEAHADLALLYAEGLPADEGRAYYDIWWQQRGAQEIATTDGEATAFLRLVPRWGNAAHLALWMQHHPERQAADFRGWASALHVWGEDEKAWGMLQRELAEPPYPAALPRQSREELDSLWRHKPDDLVNARNYAQVLEARGETEAAEKVIVAVAQQPEAPQWFLEKAAHQLARQRRFSEAVELALRPPKTVAPAETPAPH